MLREVFFIVLLVSSAAHAAKRVALVIGNSSYRYAGELTNPRHDATDMAAALRTLGFQVIDGLDLDKSALERKIREFSIALQGAEVGVFFYAGHGLQVSGQNYIVPTDAQLTTLAALEVEMMRFESVQRIMESEDRINILFFDACRDNPLARNLAQAMGTRSMAIGRGLAPVQSGQGTLISFSTQPGNVAADGSGPNSPFTGALVRHLLSSNEEIMGLLVDVRIDVMRETNRQQVPWEHTALTGRFYFKTVPEVTQPAPAPQIVPGIVLPAPSPQSNASDAERGRVAYDRGDAALDRGDFDQAIADYSEAINRDRNNSYAFNNRGIAYSKKGNFGRAIADYSEAIRLQSSNPRVAAFKNRAWAYYASNDFDKAIADYNEVIRLNPQDSNSFNNRGLAYGRKGNLDRSIVDFDEAIRLNPRDAVAFNNRGIAYAQKSDFNRAIIEFNEAIRLNPNYANALYFRGLAKKGKGDKSGDADMARAKRLDPAVGR